MKKDEFHLQKGWLLLEYKEDVSADEEQTTDSGLVLPGQVAAKMTKEKGFETYKVILAHPECEVKAGDTAYIPIGVPITIIPMDIPNLHDERVALINELNVTLVKRK